MKNNKTTELAANTNLAGWKIISRTISQRARAQGGPGSANSAVFEVWNWLARLFAQCLLYQNIVYFCKNSLFCDIITVHCRHVWPCDDQTCGRHQPWPARLRGAGDTRHVTSGVTMSGITRLRVGDVAERKMRFYRGWEKREKRPTDTVNTVDSQACLVASLYCPLVVSHSCSHSQIRGSLAIKVITALIREEIHPATIQRRFNCPGQWSDNGAPRLRMSRNADGEADSQTHTQAGQRDRSAPGHQPGHCQPNVCLMFCVRWGSLLYFARQKTTNNLRI